MNVGVDGELIPRSINEPTCYEKEHVGNDQENTQSERKAKVGQKQN